VTEKITRQEKLNLANRIKFDKNLSPATRLVGCYIADHVNKWKGYAWPPQEKIASDLGIDERTVRRAVKDLASYFGINRSQRQHEYHPIPDKLSAITSDDTGHFCSDTGQKCTPKPDKDVPPSFLDPSKHPLYASTDVDGAPAKSKKRKGSRQEQQAATDDGFRKFWESYPRKVAKKAAEKAFARAIKETTLEQMLAGLAIDKQDWKEERFTPHPATWLNGGRYLDHQDKLNPLKTYRPPGHEDD
jgi:hypothetical protein